MQKLPLLTRSFHVHIYTGQNLFYLRKQERFSQAS